MGFRIPTGRSAYQLLNAVESLDSLIFYVKLYQAHKSVEILQLRNTVSLEQVGWS